MAAEQALTSAEKLGKAYQWAQIAAVGVEVVADTILKIDDATRRRNAALALSTLSQAEQQRLNEQMARARTLTERIGMIGNLIVQQRVAIIELEQKQQLRRAMIAGGAILVITIVALAATYIKRKK